MSRLKVAHVIRTLNASNGGPPAVVAMLARHQHQHHDVSVVYERDEGPICIDQAIEQSIKLFELPPSQPLSSTPAKMKRDLHQFLAGHDVIHLHGVWGKTLRLATNIARELGIPVVLSPHGMLNTWSLAQNPMRKKLAFRLGYSSMIHSVQKVIALSKFEEQCVRAWGYTGQMDIIPNGIDLEEIETSTANKSIGELFPALNAEKTRYVLFLARLHYVKRLDLLIDAFTLVRKRFSDTELVVIGPDGGMDSWLRERVKELELDASVHVLGSVWGAGKYVAMKDASLYCLPSDHESFSVAIVEAMACGCPVVLTKGCNFNVHETEQTGIVADADPHSLAAAMSTILENNEYRDQLSRNAVNCVATNYQWPDISAKLGQIYSDLGNEDTGSLRSA